MEFKSGKQGELNTHFSLVFIFSSLFFSDYDGRILFMGVIRCQSALLVLLSAPECILTVMRLKIIEDAKVII